MSYWFAALRDTFHTGRRHIDHRRGIYRNGHLPAEHAILFLPIAGDQAIGRVMRRLHEAQVSHRLGPHDDVLEARLLWVGLDAREVLVEPDAQVAHEHNVIPGVHRWVGGIAVPQLPDGGRALLDHVAPARIVLLRGNGIGQIRPPAVREHAHQPLAADQPRAYVAVS